MASPEEARIRGDIATEARATIDILSKLGSIFAATQRPPLPAGASLRELVEHMYVLMDDVNRASGGKIQLADAGPIDVL